MLTIFKKKYITLNVLIIDELEKSVTILDFYLFINQNKQIKN